MLNFITFSLTHLFRSHQENCSIEIIVVEKIAEAVVEVSVDGLLTRSQLRQKTSRPASNTIPHLVGKHFRSIRCHFPEPKMTSKHFPLTPSSTSTKSRGPGPSGNISSATICDWRELAPDIFCKAKHVTNPINQTTLWSGMVTNILASSIKMQCYEYLAILHNAMLLGNWLVGAWLTGAILIFSRRGGGEFRIV